MPAPANRRMPLSCEPCRERKIRCPRNSTNPKGPCETCIRRGIHPADCIYLRDLQPRRQVLRQKETQEASNAELLARIRNLEELLSQHVVDAGNSMQGRNLVSVEENGLQSPESIPQTNSSLTSGSNAVDLEDGNFSQSTPESIASSCGMLTRSRSGHERYEPLSSKWSSILKDNAITSDLKADLDGGQAESDFPITSGNARIQDMVSRLPPVSHCDALVKVYFDVFAPVSTLNACVDMPLISSTTNCLHYSFGMFYTIPHFWRTTHNSRPIQQVSHSLGWLCSSQCSALLSRL